MLDIWVKDNNYKLIPANEYAQWQNKKEAPKGY